MKCCSVPSTSSIHHTYVIYVSAKFEVAASNGLGGDAFTRNITAVHVGTHVQTDGPTLVPN